eukprot:1275650-Pleurochrysis_carterae.AAC.1
MLPILWLPDFVKLELASTQRARPSGFGDDGFRNVRALESVCVSYKWGYCDCSCTCAPACMLARVMRGASVVTKARTKRGLVRVKLRVCVAVDSALRSSCTSEEPRGSICRRECKY